MEAGEADAVGAVDDDGVGVGDVEAAFDDGGAEEDVGFATKEGAHGGVDGGGGHLAVGDDDAGFGEAAGKVATTGFEAADFVVDEVDLAAATGFAFAGFDDDAVAGGGDEGDDGETVGGGGDDGEVADAGEGEGEGAGDGGGGEGEDVGFGAHLFEVFFVTDAEAVFFVDDGEAEATEVDIFLEEGVGADDDVGFAAFEAGEDGAAFFVGDEAGEEVDAGGEAGEAVGEGAVVLFGE